MAGRFVGCGRPRWLAPTGYRSRTRERCICLSLLRLGSLSLRLAGCSDVVHWPPQLPAAWASASRTHPPAGFVALAPAGVALPAPLAHSARVVLSALLALAFPASGTTRTAILVRLRGCE